MDEFNNILSIISKDNKHCYLMGDFNLDLLNYEQHTTTQEFLDTLFSHMIIPLISGPTRDCSLCNTHWQYFPKLFLHNILSGNILNDLSDHFPIFTFFNNEYFPQKTELKSVTHDFSKGNLSNFRSCLSQVDWTNVGNGQDPSTVFDAFVSEYNHR
jgi:hypothetical protein